MTKRPAAAVVAYMAAWALLITLVPVGRVLWPFAVTTTLFAVAVWALARARLTPRAAAWVVLGVGAVLQVVMLTRAPLTSDDANRYVWDAKVQLAGIDPYRYTPQDPHLAPLRQPDLFGPTSACTHPIPGGCTAINRPDVRTVYPPVAQLAFDGGRVLSFGGHGGVFVYQLLGALGALAIGALLARRALRRGRAVWPVALWAWCPVVLSEFGNNGHLDWLGVLLTVLAFECAVRNRCRWAGFLIGAAIVTKLYPALALPALLRRRPWLVGLTAVATVALSYVPHVLAVGTQVIGYLPGYLHEEGYDSGSRLLLLGAFLPHPVDTIVGAVALATVAWWAWRRADASVPEQTAVVLVGVAFLVTTPSYGWYAGLLLALVILSSRYEWMPVVIAPSVVYLGGTRWWDVLTYALAALATLLLFRARISKKIGTLEPPATVLTNV